MNNLCVELIPKKGQLPETIAIDSPLHDFSVNRSTGIQAAIQYMDYTGSRMARGLANITDVLGSTRTSDDLQRTLYRVKYQKEQGWMANALNRLKEYLFNGHLAKMDENQSFNNRISLTSHD